MFHAEISTCAIMVLPYIPGLSAKNKLYYSPQRTMHSTVDDPGEVMHVALSGKLRLHQP